jgi:hypothetical protein
MVKVRNVKRITRNVKQLLGGKLMEKQTKQVTLTIDDTEYQIQVTKIAQGFVEVKQLQEKLEQANKNIRTLINVNIAKEKTNDMLKGLTFENEYYDNRVKRLRERFIITDSLISSQTDEKQSYDKILNQENKVSILSNKDVKSKPPVVTNVKQSDELMTFECNSYIKHRKACKKCLARFMCKKYIESQPPIVDLCEFCEIHKTCQMKLHGKVDECEIFRKHFMQKVTESDKIVEVKEKKVKSMIGR